MFDNQAVDDFNTERIGWIKLLTISRDVVPQIAVMMLTGHRSEQPAKGGVALGVYN
jgi:hypothetical protein